MEKKKMQKLNKAAVATVLAASGVTITAPVLPTKASTHFNDLNPNADYYQPVLELANRGYISGYQDGTFRPNQAITRGQAAKMLAMALNLNITKTYGGKVENGEIGLPMSSSKLILPCGIFGRWEMLH